MLIASGLDGDSRWSFAARCDGRDAMTYYYAALGLVEGLNPYDRAEILRHLNETPHFVYPIFTLPFFLPLVVFEPPTALVLFGVAHLVGFVALIAIWRRLLPIDWRLQALLLPVGFGATAIHDLCSSNVVTFEALAVWLGIALLWQGKPNRFLGWVTLAALFKFLWLALLPLALRYAVASWRACTAVIATLMAALVAWFFLWPQTFWQWLVNVRSTTAIRYNVFTALRTLDESLGGAIGGPLLDRWETWAYGFWIAFVLAVVIALLRRGLGIRSLSLLAPLTLLVLWPGNLSYSWLIALPIASALIFFLAARGQSAFAIAMTAICIVPQPMFEQMESVFPFGQRTFCFVVFLWIVVVAVMWRMREPFETWLRDTT